MAQIEIIIPLIPRTKKNSQQIGFNKYSGKPFVSQSKLYKQYERDCKPFLSNFFDLGINYPVNIKTLYYVPDNRLRDLVGLHQAMQDVLVKYKILEDDNSKIVVSLDGSRVYLDRENPRTEIYITGIDK